MLKFGKTDGPEPKCHATLGTLPPYIDLKQPPTKKKPFGVINDCPFVQSVPGLDMMRSIRDS